MDFFHRSPRNIFTTLFYTVDEKFVKTLLVDISDYYRVKYNSIDGVLGTACVYKVGQFLNEDEFSLDACVTVILVMMMADEELVRRLTEKAYQEKDGQIIFILQKIPKAIMSHLKKLSPDFQPSESPDKVMFPFWMDVLNSIKLDWEGYKNPQGLFDYSNIKILKKTSKEWVQSQNCKRRRISKE